MWFKWWRNYPNRYKAMARGIAYAFFLLGAAAGLIFWIVSGFKSFEGLILAAVSIVLFFVVRMLMKNIIVPEVEEEQKHECEE